MSSAGSDPVPLSLVAKSPTARVAVEWTVAGVQIGPHVFQCRGLPGGMLPPRSKWLNGEMIDYMLQDERLICAWQVTVQKCGRISEACEWWVRRPDSALPLALVFAEPREEIALPADGFTAGICALTVTAEHRDPIILDVEKTCAALAELRSFCVDACYGDTSQLTRLKHLATLPSRRLFHAANIMNFGDRCMWLAQCNQMRHVFFEHITDLTKLQGVAAC